jgi:hypothetical protein
MDEEESDMKNDEDGEFSAPASSGKGGSRSGDG